MANMKKYIIGLGCSWTQGEGGYPDEIWHEYNGRPQISLRGKDDYHIRHYEHENSWVNVLCRDHFTDHTPINLGIKGIGNRAAVEQLHFCDRIDWENSTGTIILMMSGFERLDLPRTDSGSNGQDDGYSNGEYPHYKWNTAWPHDSQHLFWKSYAKELWSERFVATGQMMALLNLQCFAKAKGFNLVIANAFNQQPPGVIEYLRDNTGALCDKFDWSTYLHNTTDYVAFVQKLVELDDIMPKENWGAFHQYYFKRTWPAEYLTNCEGAHPTIKGYKVIADELATFIKYKRHV
jgi:hypothetical protein